jgi:heptosyltransferase-2
MKNILIIQTAFLGDVILVTPLVKAVKKVFPDCFLSFLLIPQAKEVLAHNPYVDEVIVYDKKGDEKGISSFFALVKKIKDKNFDLSIIPHRSLRSVFLAYFSKIPNRIGFDRSSGSFLLTQKIRYVSNLHEIERDLSLLSESIHSGKELNFDLSEKLPKLFPSKEDFYFAEKFLENEKISEKDKIVGIAPGSVWATKRWLPERFAEVADLLMEKENIKAVLLGGKEDGSLCQKIADLMKKKPSIAAGKTNILQSSALISKCELLLSNDSAPVHLGVAMRRPVIAIFGSTIPEFGFGPYGENNVILQKELYCRPCGIHGKRKCPEKHFKCMKEITTEEVLEAILSKLST